jgi:hypothetical protein
MTFIEKLKQEHPETITYLNSGDINYAGIALCPSEYGYELKSSHDDCEHIRLTCEECWNREMPEIEEKPCTQCKNCPHKNTENQKGETKMEGKVTTRKTKAELLEEIAELKKQAERAGRYEQCDEAAADIKAVCDSFINAGFSREDAFALTLKLIETAGKVGR